MNERLKLLRKKLKLNQRDFAEKISLAQGHYSSIENGKSEITDRSIKLLCTEFNVNEDWLRNGTGEMFIKTKQSIINSLAKQYNLDPLDVRIITEFAKLNPQQRKVIKVYMQKIVESDDIFSVMDDIKSDDIVKDMENGEEIVTLKAGYNITPDTDPEALQRDFDSF